MHIDFFIKRISIFFKSLIMQSTKTMSFVWSCASRNRTLPFWFKKRMMFNMLSHTRKKLKIFGSIIQGIFIDVVDCFVFQKRPAKQLFHDYTMFIFPFSRYFDFNVLVIACIVNNFRSFWFKTVMLFSDNKFSGAIRYGYFTKTFWASFGIKPNLFAVFTILRNYRCIAQFTIFFKRFLHNFSIYHRMVLGVK